MKEETAISQKIILHGAGMTKRFEETEVMHGIDIDVYAGDFLE